MTPSWRRTRRAQGRPARPDHGRRPHPAPELRTRPAAGRQAMLGFDGVARLRPPRAGGRYAGGPGQRRGTAGRWRRPDRGLHGRFAVGVRAEPFQSRAHDGRRPAGSEAGRQLRDLRVQHQRDRARGRAQRRRGVPDQRRHLGRHHGGRGRRHSTIGRGKPAYDSSTGLVRRRPDWRAGPEQRHDQPAAGHAGNGAGPGYINIAAALHGAATTLAAEGTCWSPPTAPSR